MAEATAFSEANPGSLEAAAQKIALRMPSPEPPEEDLGPTGEEAEAPETANRESQGEDQPGPEPTQEEETPDGDAVELPHNVSELAEALGVDVDDLLDIRQTVKINGEEKEVSLKEALSGFQFEGDYRRNQAELAEQRRQISQFGAALQAEREHFDQRLSPLIQSLKEAVASDEAELQRLQYDDPEEWRRKSIQLDERRKSLQMAEEEKKDLNERQEKARAAELWNDVRFHADKLIEAVPEWGRDQEKGRKEIAEIKDFVVRQYGFDPQDVMQEYRSPMLLAARDLMKFHNLMKTKETRIKEVKTKPKYLKPGTVRQAETAKTERVKKARLRLKKTGSTKDFASVLAQRMKG